MTTTAFGDATATDRTGYGGAAGTPGDVAELVRQCSRLDGRRGFRIVARGLSGHIFFERGRVIHAEFGEDCGLRAVVEMLRSGSVLVEPAASWPSQPSLHLGPELLLSMTGKDASRVVRKVDLPVEPPPLPDPSATRSSHALPEHAATADRVVPDHSEEDHSEEGRPATRRAVSGVMPRVVAPLVEPPGDASRAPARSRTPTGRDALREMAPKAKGPGLASTRATSNPEAASPTARPAWPGPSTNPSSPSLRTQRAPRLQSSPRGEAPLAAALMHEPLPRAPLPPTPRLPAPPLPVVPRPPEELPVTRAQKARSRSVVVARAARVAALASAPESTLPPRTPIQAPSGQQPTTMVRIASRGDLLAARGESAEQLAEAAAFIHGLANLIAADFGRQGRANVHLSGHGVSLLVARSEVNDIAAALGPTERMTSLLSKVGLK